MYALHTLNPPDSLVAGYRRGDEIGEQVVRDWGLVVGVDVSEEQPGADTVPGPVAVRPGPEANRQAWEAYGMANGMTAEEAADASQEDLEGIAEPDGAPERPSDSAKKAEWVKYVSALAPDDATRSWATADDTTKAALQDWQPGANVGTVDTVAMSATEQNQG